MRNIMLDIETMGTVAGSAIVQIGAVEFSASHIGEPFSVNISLESCISSGLRMDPNTVMWWMQQSEQARNSLTVDTVHLKVALSQFAEWLCHDRPAIWGDGAAFDNVLLLAAYRATRMPPPWHFSADRCFRTMKELFPVDRVVPDCPHNAASDAIAQAVQMQAIIAKYGISVEASKAVDAV